MAARSRSQRPDVGIARLARRQHGVVSRRQLLAAGLTRHQISERIRAGRLHRLHGGVDLVGHAVPPRYARETAAVLACPDSILDRQTSASLWDLLPYPQPGPVRLAIPPGRSAERPGIDARRAVVAPGDVRRRHGLPLTGPPRTIADLAAILDDGALERTIADARYRGLASEEELAARLARDPGRRGNARLRRVLDLPGGPGRTRSAPERRLIGLLREAGIGGFEANARAGGYEIDLLWRGLGFGVEVDGWAAHGGRVAFERDRLKAATLASRGIGIVPVTPRQIRDDPTGVVERVRRAVERARGAR